MSLSRRLAKRETLATAQAAEATPAPTYWTLARKDAYCQWAIRILESMPAERGAVVYAELMRSTDRWGPVARRVDRMACLGADGIYDAATWPYWADRAIALPEAVCEVLERHPDASYKID